MNRIHLYAVFGAIMSFATSQATSAWQAPSASPVPTRQTIPQFLVPSTRWTSDADLHAHFLNQFRAAVGLGVIRMPSLRAPFNRLLTLRVPNSEDPSADPVVLHYGLADPELIGIATRATPVAFVARHEADASAATRTRPLTALEQRALTTVRAGSNVTGETTSDGRHVVGAVRATSECLACHATFKTGDLLGALSYRLIRITR